MLFLCVFHVGYKTKEECQKGNKALKDRDELEPGQRQLAVAEEFCVAMRLILTATATLWTKKGKAVFSRCSVETRG